MKTTYSHFGIGGGRCTAAISYPTPSDRRQVVDVGLSLCSPADQFRKNCGREWALARLRGVTPSGTTSDDRLRFSFPRDLGIHLREQVWEVFLSEVSDDRAGKYPRWVHEAVGEIAPRDTPLREERDPSTHASWCTCSDCDDPFCP